MSFVGLESVMNQAWDMLMDKGIKSIAICGGGGIGKTTLMRQIYNKLARTQLFETLIWVTLSSNSTPVKILDDISKSIGIFDAKWVHTSSYEKARLISHATREKKFVLFLDDMWRSVDTYGIGFPMFEWDRRPKLAQKLMFTTRSERVATVMFARKLKMNVLSMADSLQLFKNNVGDNMFGDPRISELPEILVARCRGLPILLCTVGRAMASKTTSKEWFDALLKIRRLEGLENVSLWYSVEELQDNILSATNMDIDPLLCMQDLKVLSITITCASALHKFFNSPKFSKCTQSLSLEILWGSKSLDISPLAAMKNLLTLEIRRVEALEELNGNFLHLSVGSFGCLGKITLVQCSNLRELTWVILVPNLKILRVESCEKMEEIISKARLDDILTGGEDVVEPFVELKILALESLPKLTSIYWKALPFQQLKKIEIIDCLLLEKLPLNSDSADTNKLVIKSEEDWWKGVEWEDDATKTTFLPCFRQSSSV